MPSGRPEALYKSILAYDGTDFHGFQRQGGGQRTVQEVVEQALSKLGWREASIKAAGRTDAGVHARGQVVCYRLRWDHTTSELTQALNANLPRDVAVRHSEPCPSGFHPRLSACRRHYGYTLITVPQRDPLRERYAWRVWPEPSMEALREAAGALIGRHDYAAFGRAPIAGGHTWREVYRASWSREQEVWRFDIVADSFLYRMVRRLVAAMVDVGMGRAQPEVLAELLRSPGDRWQGRIAPSCGLCLEAVSYDEPSSGKEPAE